MSSNEDYVLVPRSSVKSGEIKGVSASSSSVVTPSATASFSPSIASVDEKLSKEQPASTGFKLIKSPAMTKLSAKLSKALSMSRSRAAKGKGKGDAAFVTTISAVAAVTISNAAQLFNHDVLKVSDCAEWSDFALVFEEYKVREIHVWHDFSPVFGPADYNSASTLKTNSKGAVYIRSITAEPYDGVTPTFASEFDRAETKICHVNPARTLVADKHKCQYCLTYDSQSVRYTQSYGWQETQFGDQHIWATARLSTDTVGPVIANCTLKRYIKFVVEFRHRK